MTKETVVGCDVGDGDLVDNIFIWTVDMLSQLRAATSSLSLVVYPAFSLVELQHCCALIGREHQSVEIFSCTERSFCGRS